MKKSELIDCFNLKLKIKYTINRYPGYKDFNCSTFADTNNEICYYMTDSHNISRYFIREFTKTCIVINEYDMLDKKTTHKLKYADCVCISTEEEIVSAKVKLLANI